MTLILYASELAACVGMNQYKSVEDATMAVWRRWDADSFQESSKLYPLAHKSPEEIFSSIGPSVHKLVSTAVSSKTENEATRIVEAAMNEKANAVSDEAAREILEARESVVREVNCGRGSQNEHRGIASYESAKRVKLRGTNTKFFKKSIGVSDSGTNVYVGGRVDGLTHDRVVEIKCRRNRLFTTLPLYEKVQVQAYLFLTDKPVAEVLQKYDGMTRTDEYVADAEFWSEVCEAALKF
ncbi:unnamed protein product, partial [Ectocarpus sp. 12 AP-2014]